MTPLALYIHWPFCKSKCPYCDFNSHVREQVDISRWRDALLNEMRYIHTHLPDRLISSIFFGGGTPSLMPPELARALIEAACELWETQKGMEITLEANPTSIEAGRLEAFARAGINRVSIGVQSFNDADLQFLGRGHSAKEAKEALKLARNLFTRYSFDLIYARPQQSLAAWEDELGEALAYANGHLSLYQLTIEENTAFYTAYAKGGFTLPDEEAAEALYRLTETITAQAGLHAYEVSNYARPGEESRHNLTYWQGGDYAGIGPGAHGRLTLDHACGARIGADIKHSKPIHSAEHAPLRRIATQAIKSPERWLEKTLRDGHGTEIWDSVDRQRESEERLMMGLRLREGIDLAHFQKQTGYNLMDYLNAGKVALYREKNLLTDNKHTLCTTLQGRLLLTTLTAELLAG